MRASSGAFYIAARRAADESDREDYQTVWAARKGAVAAPTASLHFDAALLAALEARGIGFTKVTLHVGAGTFLPVKVEDVTTHKMHAEWGEVSKEAAAEIAGTKAAGAAGAAGVTAATSGGVTGCACSGGVTGSACSGGVCSAVVGRRGSAAVGASATGVSAGSAGSGVSVPTAISSKLLPIIASTGAPPPSIAISSCGSPMVTAPATIPTAKTKEIPLAVGECDIIAVPFA